MVYLRNVLIRRHNLMISSLKTLFKKRIVVILEGCYTLYGLRIRLIYLLKKNRILQKPIKQLKHYLHLRYFKNRFSQLHCKCQLLNKRKGKLESLVDRYQK